MRSLPTKRVWAYGVGALATCLFSLTGCGDSASSQPPDSQSESDAGPDAAVGATGRLRFLHAAASSGQLDVYLQGQTTPILTSIAYGTTTGQMAVPVGTYQLEVRQAGGDPTKGANYVSDPVTVTLAGSITVLGAGVLTTDPLHPPDAAIAFRTFALPETFSAPVPGKTHVRVVNALSIHPYLDFGDDGSVEIASLAPFATSDTVELTAGSDAEIAVQPSGTTPTREGTFAIPATMLGDGADVYVVLMGSPSASPRDPGGLAVDVVVPAGQGRSLKLLPEPVVFLLPVSPGTTALDGYVDGQELFDNIGFGAISGRAVPATTTGHTLELRPAGADPGSLALALTPPSTGPLEAGQQYLAVVTGLINDPTGSAPLSLHVYRHDMDNASAFELLRVVNAGIGAGTVDVGLFSTSAGSALQFTPLDDFASLPVGGASPMLGSSIGGTVSGGALAGVPPLIAGVQISGDPARALVFSSLGSMGASDRWFGIFAGVWSAPVGSPLAPRFLAVKTTPTNQWDVAIATLSPNGIAMTPSSASLIVGHTQQYVATAQYGNGTVQDVTSTVSWTPGSITVAQLSNTTRGLFTAVAAGTTTIKAATTAAPIVSAVSPLTVRVVAGPSVSATLPSDGASGVSTITPISVTFDRPVTPATLTAQIASGTCSGSLQLSPDNFTTCVGFAAAAPAMTADHTVAAIRPLWPLDGTTTYKLRVAGVTSEDGPAMTAAFVQATGFGTTAAVPGPAVASAQPGDGSTAVDTGTAITVTFDRAIAPATLTTQTATGPCSGSLQLSADGFGTCIGFATAAPAMASGDTVATAHPAAALTTLTSYQIRVLGTVTTPAGFPGVTTFTQATGFTTRPPDVPLTVASTQPADGAQAVSTLTPIVVTFNQAITPASLTTQTAAGGCSGSLQLSSDNFATCLGFVFDAPTMDATSAVATAALAAPLRPQTTYKIRVLGSVTSAIGIAIGGDVTQAFGFTTATQLAVAATQPADAATGVELSAPITITFDQPIAPATLTTQTAAGSCAGTLQLSADHFTTCVAFAAAAPALDVSNTVATAHPAAALSGQTTYQIRISGSVQSSAGVPIGADVTQPTGFRTTCAGRLVISQVYGGGPSGGTFNHDFIELHNAGQAPVDVRSYALQAGLASTSTWTSHLLQPVSGLSAIIPPGGYFLVEEGGTGTANFPVAVDAAPLTLNLSATAYRVALTLSSTTLTGCAMSSMIDLVGYGATASCSEGSSPAPGLTATTGAFRGDGGCSDSNVNSADFTAAAPVPRNSASPAHLCSCPN